MKKLTLLISFLVACSGVSAEVRTAYSVEATHCALNERAIVQRSGTTREQDAHDLVVERARCDAALHAIEAAR